MPLGTVVCIGRNSIDHYYKCKNRFFIGEKILLEPIGSYYGGMIPNAATVLASVGVDAILFDTLGEDVYCSDLVQDLNANGVNTRFIHFDKTCAVAENSIIMNDVDGNLRSTILIMDKPRVPYKLSKEERECMADAQFIYTTTKDLASLADFDAFDFFNQHSSRLVLDVEDIELSVSDQDKQYLIQADILIFNKSGYDKVTGDFETNFFKELLSSKPEKSIIHTQGNSGCTVYYHSKVTKIDGIAVPTIDTTGAGDTFNAVLMARLLQGDTPEAAARTANKAAALSTTVVGPRGYVSLMQQGLISLDCNQQKIQNGPSYDIFCSTR